MSPRAVARPGPRRCQMGILRQVHASLVLACFCESFFFPPGSHVLRRVEHPPPCTRCCRWVSLCVLTFFSSSGYSRTNTSPQTPADFEIALYTSHDVLARLSEHARIAHLTSPLPSPSTTTGDITTRTRYARIRAVHAGVPVPNSRSHPRSAFSSSPSPRGHARPAAAAAARSTDAEDAPAQAQDPSAVEAGEEGVPLVVILEPAYWGVLPATLLPTVGVLVPVVLAAALVVHPWVMAYLEPFVRQATEDVKKTDARAK